MTVVGVERQDEIAIVRRQPARELAQGQFDDILVAAKRFQKRAYEAGEPQRFMKVKK